MAIFERGARFANHVVVRLIAAGRVAEVYEVLALDGARRALKVLKVDAPLESKPTGRLAQEGEAIATIEHVNVLRFYAAGVEEGRVWLLLELVDGPDLRRLVRAAGGRLPVERAVRIVRQACEGVAAAHQLGILHRDLQPENILVGGDDLVKVGDFGSAHLGKWGVKTTREQDLSSSLYTAPEYMRERQAEPRSDVYSMGLILYEILAGAHPIASTNAMEICLRQIAPPGPPWSGRRRGRAPRHGRCHARSASQAPYWRSGCRRRDGC
jgi:eukaryotic-like serine/threonine-protein kinase